MRKIEFYIILIVLLILTKNALPQANCVVPESPQLTLVTVDPVSGNVNLSWNLSPSSDIAGYVVYRYNTGTLTGITIDTIWNPSATNYTHITPATRYFSVSYVVAAHRMPNCTSPLSNNLNTLFAEAVIDTCNKIITISWNKYIPEPKKVTGYKISASVNGGSFYDLAWVDSDSLKYTLRDFTTDAEYCFIVSAILEDQKISGSNKVCLSTAMQRPPEWINADYATVEDNKVSLSFTADPLSEISNFRLERKTGNTASFTEIARPASSAGVIKYTDDKADPGAVNYYRLSAINSCNKPITVSNLASNIVLEVESMNSDLVLRWNNYTKWNGEIRKYNIFMNTGTGFKMLDINTSDTLVVIDYKYIMYEITAGVVCFKIGAEEVSNPYGITGSTLSGEDCFESVEKVTVPDVFTPNSDNINDLFRPVLSFTPVDYILVIRDRQGKTIFETKDHLDAWDGSYRGDPLPQGVYLWSLRILSPSGNTISKTGTITVYFNR